MDVKMERTRRTINVALAFACVATGGAVCVWLIESKPAAPKRSSFSHVLEVTVEPIDTSTEQTPVVGYGSVRAKNEVKIVPQVSGQLTFVHEDLATGNEIPRKPSTRRCDSLGGLSNPVGYCLFDYRLYSFETLF